MSRLSTARTDAEPESHPRLLVREKLEVDRAECLEVLLRVHERDDYPVHLPHDLPGFLTPEYEAAAWVAECDGRIVGHVALHRAAVDPTLAAAQRATGLPPERLAVVSRLFTDPHRRRGGVGRALLRHATRYAESRGQRAVLDVGQGLSSPIALYEAEGWERVAALGLRLGEDPVLDLWVYVSPAAEDRGGPRCVRRSAPLS